MSLFGRVRGLFRSDGWVNPFTGFGTSRDKTASTYFVPELRLSDIELSGLYHGDAIARRIVEIVPRTMLRQGLTWKGKDEIAFRDKVRSLGLAEAMLEAYIWARLFGGALLILGADDGQTADQPLNELAIRSFSFFKVYDRRRVSVERRVQTEEDQFYGEPEVYRINRLDGGMAYVHRSRVIRFGGAMTGEEERRGLDGWDYSVLQAPYKAMRSFGSAYQAVDMLLTDASQGVFTMRGLIDAIAMGGQNGQADLMTRATLLDMGRSAARAIMLDADGETFTKVATSFAAVPEVLDRFANLLSAVTGIPVTKLMGQAPAGLNATGESDTVAWYDEIKAEQESELRPIAERIAYLISLPMRWEPPALTFPSLWQETPAAKADRRLKVAQRDTIYLTDQVVTPEEVALSRFGDRARDPDDIAIDRSLRVRPVALPARPAPALPAPSPAPAPGAPPPAGPKAPT